MTMKVRQVVKLIEADGWRLHLEGLRLDGETIPAPSAVATTVIPVPAA
jgi:predicted RNase H-like HicB family nuclease